MSKTAREVIADCSCTYGYNTLQDEGAATVIRALDAAGFVIVPKELNEQMETALFYAVGVIDCGREDVRAGYRAMIAAASKVK